MEQKRLNGIQMQNVSTKLFKVQINVLHKFHLTYGVANVTWRFCILNFNGAAKYCYISR